MPGFSGEAANLVAVLRLDDSGFAGKLAAANRNVGSFGRGFAQMGAGVGQVGRGIDKIVTRLAIATAAAGTAIIGTAVSFEDAFAGVRKTVDASDTELDALMETFRAMAREIPISFEELSAIGEQAGALGIATASIDEFTRTVALLGETTDVTTDQAATSLGVLANVLNLTEADFDNFGSALVDLGNKGASTESQILALAERAGAGASLVGIAADKTLGWSAAIANLGIEVEAGGTALQKFFVESLKLIQDDDTLSVLAETAGVTGAAFKKAFEQDASSALQTFIVGLGKLSNAERLAVLDALGFSDIRITRALLGLAGDTDNLTDSLTISSAAWKENTALQTEAAKRFETTRSKLDLVINNLKDVGYVIGNEVLPVVADLSTEFVNFLNQPGTRASIKEFADNLGAGVRGLVTELKGTDFSGLLSGLKVAADAASFAFDRFRSLPPNIQAILVGAFALNKVSGGAIGDIVSGALKIGLGAGGIFTRGSSPANPMWVQSVGGIPGAGGPTVVGGGGGIFGTITKFLGLATAASLGVAIGSEIGNALFYEPTVKPARDREIAVIEGVIQRQSPAEIAQAIRNLEGSIEALSRGSTFNVAGFDLGPISGIMQLLSTKERELLEQQLAVLREQLKLARADAATNIPTSAKIREGGPLSPKPVLPNTAFDAGGGVVNLPDTAMLPLLREIAANTRPLAPITSRAEQAAQATRRAVNDSKFALQSAIERKQFSANVTAAVTVNTYVSGTMFAQQRSRTNVAAGYRGGIPIGPG